MRFRRESCYNIVITERHAVKSRKLKVESRKNAASRPPLAVLPPFALCSAPCAILSPLSGLYIIRGIQPPVAPEVIKIEPLHGFFL